MKSVSFKNLVLLIRQGVQIHKCRMSLAAQPSTNVFILLNGWICLHDVLD